MLRAQFADDRGLTISFPPSANPPVVGPLPDHPDGISGPVNPDHDQISHSTGESEIWKDEVL